jgi:hypothetical protein
MIVGKLGGRLDGTDNEAVEAAIPSTENWLVLQPIHAFECVCHS